MTRRRILESEEEEVTRWVEILNKSKDVEESRSIEFDLSTAEEHDEYVVKLRFGKSAGSEECKGNINLILNGMGVGYFLMNTDISANPQNYTIDIVKPVKIVRVTNMTVSPEHNTAQLKQQECLGAEKGTGKLELKFPANYTGTVSAQVFAK